MNLERFCTGLSGASAASAAAPSDEAAAWWTAFWDYGVGLGLPGFRRCADVDPKQRQSVADFCLHVRLRDISGFPSLGGATQDPTMSLHPIDNEV